MTVDNGPADHFKGSAMRKRIVRISPLQAGKVFAVLYGLISISMTLMAGLSPHLGSTTTQPFPWGLFALMPVAYVVAGFIFTDFAAWLYNLVAGWTGGIEFVMEEKAG